MAYATGLRLLAFVCAMASLTIILAPITIPLSLWFWHKARQKEKAKDKQNQVYETVANRDNY